MKIRLHKKKMEKKYHNFIEIEKWLCYNLFRENIVKKSGKGSDKKEKTKERSN